MSSSRDPYPFWVPAARAATKSTSVAGGWALESATYLGRSRSAFFAASTLRALAAARAFLVACHCHVSVSRKWTPATPKKKHATIGKSPLQPPRLPLSVGPKYADLRGGEAVGDSRPDDPRSRRPPNSPRRTIRAAPPGGGVTTPRLGRSAWHPPRRRRDPPTDRPGLASARRPACKRRRRRGTRRTRRP